MRSALLTLALLAYSAAESPKSHAATPDVQEVPAAQTAPSAEPEPTVEASVEASIVKATPAVVESEPEPAPEPAAGLHDPWDAILKATLRDERVDYAAVKSTHRAALTAYLDTLSRVDPGSLARKERLALYINLYNATMVSAIADRYRAGYSVSESSFGVFDEPLVRVGGAKISLNDLEHKRVRPMGDARIHAALVCGAISCPPLISSAYTAKNVNYHLENNTKRWIANTSRNTIDTRGKELKLSSIFDWYAEDFGGKEGLAAWVDTYTDEDVAGFTVSFVEYDWTLNGR